MDILSSYSSTAQVPTASSPSILSRKSRLSNFLSRTLSSALSKYPLEWASHPKSDDFYYPFPLLQVSKEYRKVAAMFRDSMSGYAITGIKRVQNKWLWLRYVQARTQLETKNAGATNEMELFHGSRDTSPENICGSEEGFDMRFSRQGLWGLANYFAVKAYYSHHYAYSRDDQQGSKEIILAKVLTGDSVESEPDTTLRLPPEKTTRHGNLKQVRYDTVNGVTVGYRVYMTYSNDRAYPAYIITYKENS